ncbi:uncharacterized protein LOC112548030 isoform X2 [Alligator sinensis]|uniref:Uncharacterized protein LOC112548030 isoform X2 n=1 Tax=Alligator sinensis TaxID=38654 RepID=A0A3Q0FKI1_ALLSI|nr:uncharacterized protein LOC112548030 isoform X2 [Alligator sinensis]
MARYRQLCRESFVGLVRGYLAHVYLKEAEEPLMQLQDSLGCPKVGSALTRLKALRKQRLQCWRVQWHQCWERQQQLALLLGKRLEQLGEEEKLLVIKRLPSWPGWPKLLRPPRRMKARFQMAAKMPALVPLGQTDFPGPRDTALWVLSKGAEESVSPGLAMRGCVQWQEVSSALAVRGLRPSVRGETMPPKLWNVQAVGKGGDLLKQGPEMLKPLVITPRLLEMNVNTYLLPEHQVSGRTEPIPSLDTSRAGPSTSSLMRFLSIRRGAALIGFQPLREARRTQGWFQQDGSRPPGHVAGSRTQSVTDCSRKSLAEGRKFMADHSPE